MKLGVNKRKKWLRYGYLGILLVLYGVLLLPIVLVVSGLKLGGVIGWRHFWEKLGFYRHTAAARSAQSHPQHTNIAAPSEEHGTQESNPALAAINGRQHRQEAIWVHLASVGEWHATLPLLEQIRQHKQDKKIVLTYFNEEMVKMANDITLKRLIAAHAFLSLENPIATWRWVRRYNVKALLLIEMEFWPLTILTTAALGVHVILVNGIIFAKEYRFLKAFRWLWMPTLRSITRYIVTTAAAGAAFKKLGVAKQRVQVIGSLKFAKRSNKKLNLPPATLRTITALKDRLRTPLKAVSSKATYTEEKADEKGLSIEQAMVIGLASVHFKEFRLLWRELGHYFTLERYRFIIAPRKIGEERQLFLRWLAAKRIPVLVRSAVPPKITQTWQQPGQHLFLDTFGELPAFLEASDCVILGGTFIPVGGHNLLEPLRSGIPTILGPYSQRMVDMVEHFKHCGGVKQVSRAQLVRTLQNIEQTYVAGRSLNAAATLAAYRAKVNLVLKKWEKVDEETFNALAAWL